MDTQGSLKKKSGIKLFHELAKEHKTGVLTLKQKKQKFEVHWKRGLIVQVLKTPNPIESRLGMAFVYLGFLTSTQIEQALSQQRRNMEPLGLLLCRLFLLEEKIVQEILLVQANEKLHELLIWSKGSFIFEEKDILSSTLNFPPLQVAPLLEEASQIKEYWPLISVDFEQGHLQITRSFGEPSEKQLASLQKLERRFYDLLEEMSDYRILSLEGGVGRFLTAFALRTLQEQGLIELVTSSDKKESFFAGVLGSTFGSFIRWSVLNFFLSLTLVYLLVFAPYAPVRLWYGTNVQKLDQVPFLYRIESLRTFHVKKALEYYRRTKEGYPNNLSLLVKEGWLMENQILDLQGKPYYYQLLNKQRYQLYKSYKK